MRLPSAPTTSGNQAPPKDRHRHLAAFLQALAKRLRALRLVGGQDIPFGGSKCSFRIGCLIAKSILKT